MNKKNTLITTNLINDPNRYWVQIQRFMATIIDMLIVVTPFYFLGEKYQIKMFNEGLGGWVVVFACLTIYSIFLEYKFGRTIGKYILGIWVFAEDGSVPSAKAIIIRNMYKIPELYFMSIIPMIVMYKSRKKQRIGDMVAHTVVLRTY